MGKKILIIEDEKPLLSALKDKFSRENLETLDAKNGKEGLEIALKKHPDLILLDLVLPIIDGLEMLKKLRKDTWGKNAIVMILTNLSDAEKLAEAIKIGVDDFMVKTDWTLEKIVKKVKKRLGK